MAKRFIFVGNRRFVLQEMLANKLEVTNVIVVRDSHLHRDIENNIVSGIKSYIVVGCKDELLCSLKEIKFDVLVSNGCPYILPIKDLPVARYVNIHPSCLPDLRGVDPVIGAILHARDAGATCHVMDDGIDTGAIISQERIKYSKDIDVTTLYQLSFIAEKRAFRKALELEFKEQRIQNENIDNIYYSRTPNDWQISFNESNEELIRKVKAFNNRSIGCEFKFGERGFRVYGLMKMQNHFLIEIVKEFPDGVIALSYENNIVFRKDNEVLRMFDVTPDDGIPLAVGDSLFSK